MVSQLHVVVVMITADSGQSGASAVMPMKCADSLCASVARSAPRPAWEGAVETAAIEFDLSAEEVRKILEPTWSGPLGALGKRMAANQLNRMAERLAGPTTITVSEAGIRLAASGSERQIDWSEVRALVERRYAWVFQLAPSGIYLIPAGAVPEAQFGDFGAHLRALAGSKYEVREGGIRRQ